MIFEQQRHLPSGWSVSDTSLVRRINIMDHSGRIISMMQNLLGLDGCSLARTIREEMALPIWGPLRLIGNKPDRLPERQRDFSGFGVELTGYSVLSRTKDSDITGCVVIGLHPLSHAVRPNVTDSLVYGDNALRGSGLFDGLSGDQISAFSIAVNGIMNNNRDQYEAGIEAFDSMLPDGEIEWIVRRAGEAGYRLCEEDAAAYKVDEMFRHLMKHGDTYNVRITNSVIFGEMALAYALGGVIRDSIIGGKMPLSGARVRLINSFVVSEQGVRYVADNFSDDSESRKTPRIKSTEIPLLFPIR